MKLLRRMALQLLPTIVLIAGLSSGLQADVYEWNDAQGGRHFADSLEAIPKDFRAQARLLIKEPSPAPAPAASTPSAVERDDEDDTTTFTAGWDRGFEAGWAAGFQAAVEQQPVCTAEPEVIVLQSAPPIMVPVPRYDTIGGYYLSPYTGTVTAPFDSGRSRGLTRREQVQRLQGR